MVVKTSLQHTTATTEPLSVLLLHADRDVVTSWEASFEEHPELFILEHAQRLGECWEDLQQGRFDILIASPRLLLKGLADLLVSDLNLLPCPTLAVDRSISAEEADAVLGSGALDCIIMLPSLERQLARRSLRAMREWHYIQERELAQGLFVEGERHFRVLFDSSLDAIILVDGRSGLLFDCNDSFVRQFLYTREDLGGMHYSDLFHGDEYDDANVFKRIRVHGTVIERQDFKDKAGEVHTMDVTATIIPWSGEFAILVTLRDVSEREDRETSIHTLNNRLKQLNESLEQRIEQATRNLTNINRELREEIEQRKRSEVQQEELNRALEEMHALIRAIIDSTPDWIYVSDTRHRYRLVNVSMAKALNTTTEALIGKTPLEAGFRREDAEGDKESGIIGFAHYTQSVLDEGQPSTNPYETITLAGRTEIFEAIRMPLIDAEGAVQGVMCVSRCITHRERTKLELIRALTRERELGELKSAFVNMVSHEFRTPLSAIQSTIDLLKGYWGRINDEKRRECLGTIQSSVTRMTEMMEDLLVLGQVQSGKMEFKPAPFVIRDVWNQLMAHLENRVQDKDRIQVHFDDSVEVSLQGDERLLLHIVLNLVTNALKYSQEAIDLGFRIHSGTLIISVKDRGIGIPEAEISKIQELFYRATNTGNIKGVGVGMFIVHQCVNLHGGTITCSSEVGMGTTFEVLIPIPQQ